MDNVFFKQKTAYDMRISDWSSDVCSSDLTVLVGRGTLRVGDIFVVGAESGKVRALIDDKGRQVKEAGPSVPVEVLGLSGVPGAGDPLSVVESAARAREVAAYRQSVARRKRTTQAQTGRAHL